MKAQNTTNNYSGPNGSTFSSQHEVMMHWNAIETALYNAGDVDSAILQSTRDAIYNQWEHSYRKYDGNALPTDFETRKQELAKAFAAMYAISPDSIMPEHISILSEVFNQQEIAALCAYVCYVYTFKQFCSMVRHN